jgi:hypothetical protein
MRIINNYYEVPAVPKQKKGKKVKTVATDIPEVEFTLMLNQSVDELQNLVEQVRAALDGPTQSSARKLQDMIEQVRTALDDSTQPVVKLT